MSPTSECQQMNEVCSRLIWWGRTRDPRNSRVLVVELGWMWDLPSWSGYLHTKARRNMLWFLNCDHALFLWNNLSLLFFFFKPPRFSLATGYLKTIITGQLSMWFSTHCVLLVKYFCFSSNTSDILVVPFSLLFQPLFYHSFLPQVTKWHLICLAIAKKILGNLEGLSPRHSVVWK